MTSEEIKAAREKKRQEDLQFVADSVNAGLTMVEIRELKPEFRYNEVAPMIKELIAEGLITQEQVDENKENGKKRTRDKKLTLSPEGQVQFILDKVRKGYTPSEIVESDKTKSLTIHKVLYQKRQLIAKEIISAEEADIAMRKKQENDLANKHKKIIDKIREYTELGYSLTEMSEFITEYSRYYLFTIKNAYIKENSWYTKEELKAFAVQRKAREAEEAQRIFESLPPEEKQRIEEEKMAEAERIEEEKRKRQEEIIARRQEKKDETNKRHQEDAEKLKKHLKSGKTMEEAAKLMRFSVPYVYKIKRESIQNNKWLTLEELKEIEEEKKQKLECEREKKKKQNIDKQKTKEKENQLRVKKEIWKLREYIEQGYTYKEISQMMSYSVAHLRNFRKLAIADNIWFTEDALKEFKRLRKKREMLEAEKAKKKEQAELDRKRKEAERAFKEEERIKKAMDNERKQKIKGYAQIYKKYKKVAKKEDKLELEGQENISTEGRREFIDVLTKLHSLDDEISEEDIQIVLNTLYMYPELANKEYIQFLISDANKKGGVKSAEKMTIELTNILRDTKFYKPLIECGRWLRKQALLPKIQAMKKKGMNNTDIGEALGISSAEVSIIFHDYEKIDFTYYENR